MKITASYKQTIFKIPICTFITIYIIILKVVCIRAPFISFEITAVKCNRTSIFNTDGTTVSISLIVYEPTVVGYKCTFIHNYGTPQSITNSIGRSIIRLKYTPVQGQLCTIFNFNSTTIFSLQIFKGNVIDCDLYIIISYAKEPTVFTAIKNYRAVAVRLECYRYCCINFILKIIIIISVFIITCPNLYCSSIITLSCRPSIFQIIIPGTTIKKIITTVFKQIII